ncbi:MAG: YceI family protein [Chloroflexota bacterium]|nr:YceI family protein [Chloroflexota bacterium]
MSVIKKFLLATFICLCISACGTEPTPQPVDIEPTVESKVGQEVSEGDGHSEIVINIQSGSVARYIVREQLARWISAKDVSGETELVTGQIRVSPEGTLIPKDSRFVVNVKSLKSDEAKRDNYIRKNALESNKFPEAVFEINAMEGWQGPLPTSGSINVSLTGNMTIHGVTKEITWDLAADVEQDIVNGIAKTEIDFNLFNIKKPRLPFILTLEDTLRLELEFVAKVQSN